MEMNKRPLWSDSQDVDTILGTIEEGNYSQHDYESIIFSLFNDIQCLKEDLSESINMKEEHDNNAEFINTFVNKHTEEEYRRTIFNMNTRIGCLEAILKDYKKQTLLDLLTHFKGINDATNRSLAESGESKYCSPFESIEVADIKDYALQGTGFEEF